MNGMWATVAGACRQLLGLDHPRDRRPQRVRLGIDDIDARGAQTGSNQVAPLDVGMWRIGPQGGAAGVPAKVMHLVAHPWHLQPAGDFAQAGGGGIEIEYVERTVAPTSLTAGSVGIEADHVGEFYGRGLRGLTG